MAVLSRILMVYFLAQVCICTPVPLLDKFFPADISTRRETRAIDFDSCELDISIAVETYDEECPNGKTGLLPCNPGQLKVKECITTSDNLPRECDPCPQKFFQSNYNRCTRCHPCSECGPNEQIANDCTDETDTVCVSIKPRISTPRPATTPNANHRTHSMVVTPPTTQAAVDKLTTLANDVTPAATLANGPVVTAEASTTATNGSGVATSPLPGKINGVVIGVLVVFLFILWPFTVILAWRYCVLKKKYEKLKVDSRSSEGVELMPRLSSGHNDEQINQEGAPCNGDSDPQKGKKSGAQSQPRPPNHNSRGNQDGQDGRPSDLRTKPENRYESLPKKKESSGSERSSTNVKNALQSSCVVHSPGGNCKLQDCQSNRGYLDSNVEKDSGGGSPSDDGDEDDDGSDISKENGQPQQQQGYLRVRAEVHQECEKFPRSSTGSPGQGQETGINTRETTPNNLTSSGIGRHSPSIGPIDTDQTETYEDIDQECEETPVPSRAGPGCTSKIVPLTASPGEMQDNVRLPGDDAKVRQPPKQIPASGLSQAPDNPQRTESLGDRSSNKTANVPPLTKSDAPQKRTPLCNGKVSQGGDRSPQASHDRGLQMNRGSGAPHDGGRKEVNGSPRLLSTQVEGKDDPPCDGNQPVAPDPPAPLASMADLEGLDEERDAMLPMQEDQKPTEQSKSNRSTRLLTSWTKRKRKKRKKDDRISSDSSPPRLPFKEGDMVNEQFLDLLAYNMDLSTLPKFCREIGAKDRWITNAERAYKDYIGNELAFKVLMEMRGQLGCNFTYALALVALKDSKNKHVVEQIYKKYEKSVGS